MMSFRMGILIFTTLVSLAIFSLSPDGSHGPAAFGAQVKKQKSKEEGKKGKTIGILRARGPNFIEVKADGEDRGRKFVPRWIGGLPAKGGGFDKAILKVFQNLKIGSRIEVSWVFEERLRALEVKVLAPPEKK